MLSIYELPWDYARSIRMMQQFCYPDLIGKLGWEGIQYGLHAERLLGLEESKIGDFCIGFDGFDHRVLTSMHDYIAAYFRFLGYRWPLLAEIDDPQEVRCFWREFAVREFHNLMRETAFARGFFDALRFANKEAGMAGEEAMRIVQHVRYKQMFYAHPKDRFWVVPYIDPLAGYRSHRGIIRVP